MLTLPTCPTCSAPMRRRRGPKGEFLGCTRYPDCRGSRVLLDGETDTARAVAPRPEMPGAVGDLLTDLRRAAGYIGAAVDVLRRRQPELETLLAKHPDAAPF